MLVPQLLNEVGSDTEPVHRTRVGFRRIRTQLRILKPIVQKKTLEYLRSSSKQIGRRLGIVRDLDIIKINLLSYYANHYPGKDFELFFWKPTFFNTYKKSYTNMQTTIQSQDFVDFQNFFNAFCSSENLGIKKNIYQTNFSPLKPKEFISTFLIQQAKKVREKEQFLKISPDDKTFHRLRIEVKRLRYSLEFFSPLLAEQPTLNLLTSLTNLQDHLGAINDFVTSINLVNSTLETENNKTPLYVYNFLNDFKVHMNQEKLTLQKSFGNIWNFYVQTNPLTLLSDCISN